MSETTASPQPSAQTDQARRALLAALRVGHRRERLRSSTEARLLREIGTPESLIGPVAPQEVVDAQRAELVEFARLSRDAARAKRRDP